jgi:hypothetical protein
MSAPDVVTRGARPPRVADVYGTVVVVGGGCYGSYYVRQLGRACAAGALSIDRVLVVDRDPACRVAREGWGPGVPAGSTLPPLAVETSEWAPFFAAWLGAAADGLARARDAIVPSPLMPHLMYEWLLARARDRWPGREVATVPLPRAPGTPWERAAPDGTHYVSFAEWTCPINCIEPARCPAVRGPRAWSMPDAIRGYAAALAAEGEPVAGPVVLHCAHRAWGVGMFDVAEVLAGDATVAAAGTAGAARVLVGTVSHCHGALNLLELGPPATPA